MKTTIEIADALFEAGKLRALKQGITFRAVVEEALRLVLAQEPEKPPFKLRDASVSGCGLHPEIRDGHWERLRDLSYEGRGG